MAVMQLMRVDPITSQKQDDAPRQMLRLLAELLRSGELPELAIGGAWHAAYCCLLARPNLGPLGIELGLFDLGVEHIRAIGSPADVVSISRSKACRAAGVLEALQHLMKAFSGLDVRPDLESCISSGVFDLCLEIVAAFAAAGVEGLEDIDVGVLSFALIQLPKVGSYQPECEAKIRGIATSLAFCMEHSLDYMQEMGYTSSSIAARTCCAVFGRDEGGSEFTFTQQHVDTLITMWSLYVGGVGLFAYNKPSADCIYMRDLATSDLNKPLLLANKNVIPYLVDALLLDPEHPRAAMQDNLKVWCQQHHCDAIAQLAVFEPAREALLQDGSVVPALEAVAKGGLSEEARELAAAALAALSDRKLQMVMDGQKHVMLSCECLDCIASSAVLGCWTAVAACLTARVGVCACRPMEYADYHEEDQRVADRARLCHVVRLDEYER
jgi:hypothetical protein